MKEYLYKDLFDKMTLQNSIWLSNLDNLLDKHHNNIFAEIT